MLVCTALKGCAKRWRYRTSPGQPSLRSLSAPYDSTTCSDQSHIKMGVQSNRRSQSSALTASAGGQCRARKQHTRHSGSNRHDVHEYGSGSSSSAAVDIRAVERVELSSHGQPTAL